MKKFLVKLRGDRSPLPPRPAMRDMAFQAGAPLQVIGLLLALDASVVVLALILFPFLWKD